MKIKKSELILSENWYSPFQIHKLKVFNWIRSYTTLKKIIRNDIKNGNKIFRVIKRGEGHGNRYLIKGSTILNLLEEIKKSGKIF